MTKITNLIQKNLLKLYINNNPSNPTNLKKRLKVGQNDLEKLSFPLRFFKNLSVGDFGCGTGEFSFLAAKNGAKVEAFDFNKWSIKIAKENSKKLRIKNCNFYEKDFFAIKKKFDFVICTGVLHHLPNPYKGLKHLTSRVKKNGFLFVGFGLDSSNISHNLMKLIVRNWGKSDYDIKKTSKYLFKNHINRSMKFGLRKEDSVIADQFINTQHYYLNIKKIFNIIRKNFFKLHSSWPPIFFPRGDSLRNDTLKINNFISSELMWSTKTIDDKIRLKNFSIKNNKKLQLFNNFKKTLNHNKNKSIYECLKKKNFSSLTSKITYIKRLEHDFDLNEHIIRFYNELSGLLFFFSKKRKLHEAKKEISKKKYIFKGTNGLGINYFIFRKN